MRDFHHGPLAHPLRVAAGPGPVLAPAAVVDTATRPHRDSQGGLGLVEVVIAVGLLVTLAAGVVHLFALSARSMVRARHRTSSLVLAVDKLEQLRAGVRIRTAVSRLLETEGERTEYLDAVGHPVGRGRTPPSGSMYVRVWSVSRLPGLDGVRVVRVTVTPARPGGDGPAPAVAPDGARLATLLRMP